jgi:membrane fusion protein, multidrug efflux system
LKHGASGKVILTEEVDNALILPQKSVFEIQDKNYVFVVNQNNEVVMKSFSPSSRFSHFYIVKDGLKPGERVVYEGIQSIKDGMVIKPQLFAMDSLLLETTKG